MHRMKTGLNIHRTRTGGRHKRKGLGRFILVYPRPAMLDIIRAFRGELIVLWVISVLRIIAWVTRVRTSAAPSDFIALHTASCAISTSAAILLCFTRGSKFINLIRVVFLAAVFALIVTQLLTVVWFVTQRQWTALDFWVTICEASCMMSYLSEMSDNTASTADALSKL